MSSIIRSRSASNISASAEPSQPQQQLHQMAQLMGQMDQQYQAQRNEMVAQYSALEGQCGALVNRVSMLQNHNAALNTTLANTRNDLARAQAALRLTGIFQNNVCATAIGGIVGAMASAITLYAAFHWR